MCGVRWRSSQFDHSTDKMRMILLKSKVIGDHVDVILTPVAITT